jgi:Putative zinc-finger
MNQHPDERQLALYAGGDLSEKDTESVKEHVAFCSECAATTSDLRSATEWLRAAQINPAPGDLDEVRARVMKVVSSAQSGGHWWRWVSAVVVAGVLAVVLRPVKQPATPRRVERVQVSAPAAVAVPEKQPLLRTGARTVRRREAGVRNVELITRRGVPESLRMTTEDPNVVILLQVGEREAKDE